MTIGEHEVGDQRASAGSTYILDNAGREAASRFPALSASFDAGTIRWLEQFGIRAGSRCLEVGGGGGSIAEWLASRVGPSGRVMVTDLDTRFLESLQLPNTDVSRHDIASDPLPTDVFDVVHARLVLGHVRERDRALARMVGAVKPGGWILIEDFDRSVVPDPSLHSAEVLSKTYVAMARLMEDRGVDRTFGRRLFGCLRGLGLENVAAEGRTLMWPASSPGPLLMRANYEQLRADMIASGYITADEFEADVAALEHPEFLMPSPILWAAWGRKSR
ncbi:MAG TPA: methyltransferase domain-containing protein [Gemmatimonadaceae bacterium]|nr:methyltransferase domain-containing protein [Gemmatimonadaceae bacterium]